MPYTYPIETEAMFQDRAAQFVAFGVPAADVGRMRSTITDMWHDGPGGWVFEWSALGAEYANQGDHYLASLVYGCAKFPCLAEPQGAIWRCPHPEAAPKAATHRSRWVPARRTAARAAVWSGVTGRDRPRVGRLCNQRRALAEPG